MYEGEISVYKNRRDIIASDNECIIEERGLWFVTGKQLNKEDYRLLYDTLFPLFEKQQLLSVRGRDKNNKTIKFIFEEKYGQVALIEYSKDDSLSILRTAWTIIESVRIREGWFAVVYTD